MFRCLMNTFYYRAIEFDAEEGFKCPSCGNDPAIVVMDGLCLGMQKTYFKGKPIQEKLDKLLTGR